MTHDDVDSDQLISRLAGPLSREARDAFRAAAQSALANVPCLGEGVAFRVLRELQRQYFDPPDFNHAPKPHSFRQNKLVREGPVGRDDPRAASRRIKWAG